MYDCGITIDRPSRPRSGQGSANDAKRLQYEIDSSVIKKLFSIGIEKLPGQRFSASMYSSTG